MDRALTVVGCFAHPDDETWVMSGSLALLAARGAHCGEEDDIRVHPAPRPGDLDETSLVEAFAAEATSG